MIIKLYVLLSHFKGWDNNFVMEVKMSNPIVSNILFVVILFVILMRLICQFEILYLKHKRNKRIFTKRKNRKTPAEMPTLHSFLFNEEKHLEENNKLILWVYDISSHRFTTLSNNGFLGNNMTYETGLLLIHPDDRVVYVHDLHLLISGRKGRITELLRFYYNGQYEMFLYNAIAMRSDNTGKVDKIIGTEEYINRYADNLHMSGTYPKYVNRHRCGH